MNTNAAGDGKFDVSFSNDLQLFLGRYNHKNYEKKIMNHNNLINMEYEVFQVKKKKILK